MPSNHPLRLASCMAPNADPMVRELALWLAARLEIPVELVDDVPWQERERRLDAGLIDLCWICGLPYVQKADDGVAIEPCVAPVMRAPRYRDEAIYYSDVIVRSDSVYRSFEDLAGRKWAYNEPRSHSGYGIVCFSLAQRGETFDYFGELVEAGSHQQALRLVKWGDAAAAAIDSTVLEAELSRIPSLRSAFRVIETLGPSPAPPWVISTRVPQALRHKVVLALESMRDDPEGAALLGTWGIAALRRVGASHYEPMREMMRVAAL